MLIPSFKIEINTTIEEFNTAFDRGLFLRDNQGEITITMDYAQSVKITESFNTIEKTCQITIPRDYKFRLRPLTKGAGNSGTIESVMKDQEFDDIVKAGSYITVYQILYNADNGFEDLVSYRKVFGGFIARIASHDRIELECEDDAWLLKQKKLTVEYGKQSVLSIVKQMCKGIIPASQIHGGKISEQTEAEFIVSGFRLKRNPTVYQAIKGLDSNFKIKAFFKDGHLYVGKLWNEADSIKKFNDLEAQGTPARFKFQHNILRDKLQYRKKEDYKMGVKVTNIRSSDNFRKEFFAGDESGDFAEIPTMDLSDRDAQSIADNYLKKVWYDGFSGNFRAIIEPYIEHGDFVEIIDPRYAEERNGKYVVAKVERTYTPKGFYQTIFLHTKITF